MSTVTCPAGIGHQPFAANSRVGMQNLSGAPGPASAQSRPFVVDHAADGALPQAGRGPGSGPGQSQAGSHSAGSVQTAADVKLSPVQSSSALECSSLEQHPSQRQVPSGSDQAMPAGAGLAQPPGQQPAALLGVEVEQRAVEEQEVLYNMTGQTGSLMYMAPEVDAPCASVLAAKLLFECMLRLMHKRQICAVRHCQWTCCLAPACRNILACKQQVLVLPTLSRCCSVCAYGSRHRLRLEQE